eukprot:gb/GFBE01006178.1/.p1 GENE.gb/GFBE01006178.1/~~gb/GFBE01006178.1/.p1  ORF type:complete len:449 (+),score=108.58 gb/GFBE01006178.1/:1-1347(+)
MKFFSTIARASVVVAIADAVTTKKMSSGVAATESAPNPWLALLTSSWSLAGKPEQEKSAGLQSLADSIVAMAKNGNLQNPDPTMQSAVESILEIVEDMKESINASNDAAQASMDEKYDTLKNCSAPSATDMTAWTAGLNTTASDVVTCRQEEKTVKENYTDCIGEQNRCANTTECCNPLLQPNTYCLPVGGSSPQPSTLEGQCNGRSKCKLNDLNAMLTYFQGKLTEYQTAEDSCTASRAGCNESYDCTTVENNYTTKRGDCNVVQTNFEQQYCDLARSVEANWDAYNTCYDNAHAALIAEETKQKEILPGRHQEWRGVLRIECLLGALQATDMTAELEKCIDTTYGDAHWAHLDLTYPSEQAKFVEKTTCSEPLETPGASNFKSAHYAEVLEEIPEELSTYHCVAALATEHCPRTVGIALLGHKSKVSHAHRIPQATRHHGLKRRTA